MTMTNADDLRAMLEHTAKTGAAPTHTELMGIGLTGNIAERRKLRSELSNEVQRLARYSSNPDEAANMTQRINDLVSKFGGGQAETPDVSGIERTYGTISHRTPVTTPTRSGLDAMISALSHAALTKTGLTDAELAALPIDPNMTAAQAQQWRTDTLAASMKVAELSASGNHSAAGFAAREAAGQLSGGLSFPEPVDHSEDARLPDGSYDPAALVANIRR
jgi:Asp-tRNA(Asn)/Glu-tRNA(Gln) amidotransferase C subunit